MATNGDTKPIRVGTLFSGYDSQCLAMNRLGVPYELDFWCEIDKHAITAHNALFPQWSDRNLGDVSKVDWEEWHKQHPQQIDLLTYSSPCQDFSSAGLQRGGEEGSGTRSGLLWETERAVCELRPQYLVFENVAALVSDKFIDLFNRWQARLNGYGYTNFSQLMNAKDYGVPQNRLRIFMVSILDCQQSYYFPKPFKLERRLKDVLEQNVDERYYLKDKQVQSLLRFNEDRKNRGMGFQWKPKTEDDVAGAVCTMAGQRQTDNYIAEPQINILGNLYDNNEQAGRIYDSNGISPTLDNMASGGNKSPKIVEPCIAAMRGRDKDNPNDRGKSTDNYTQRLELKPDGTSNTLPSFAKDNLLIEPIIIDATNDFSEEKKRTYTEYSPALRSSRSGLMTIENASVAKDNLLIEPQFHDADDIPFDDGKGGIIWAKYESEEYYRLMNEYWEKEWEKLKQNGIQLTLGENESAIISPGHGYFEGSVNTETSPTVKCSAMQAQHFVSNGIRIRRLSERELYRLMDVDESDIDTLLNAPIPRTQHAKLAGNSIVVACLYYIFRNLFVDTEPAAGVQTELF